MLIRPSRRLDALQASPELVKAAEDAAKHNQDLKFVVVPYAEGLVRRRPRWCKAMAFPSSAQFLFERLSNLPRRICWPF